MSFAKEFKEFINKGNVIDLAIAVIIGAAFAAIISSLVDDVITPLLLAPALKAAHVEDLSRLTWGTVKYGLFLSNVLKFLIIALVLFLIVQGLNKMKHKEEVKADIPTTPELTITEKLLTEIRNELSNSNKAGSPL